MERREFLKWLAASGLTTLGMPAPLLSVGRGYKEIDGLTLGAGKAKSVILIWLAGGMAHTETFDPKPRLEFEKGLDSRKLLSTFNAIPTTVDGIKISQGLEGIASVMDRGTLIRSWKGPDLGPVLHPRHQYHWHTGYIPPQTVLVPHIGGWISRILGPKNDYAPQFVEIGQNFAFGGAEEVRAYFTGGFLGSQYGPLHIPDPAKASQSLDPPERLGREGVKRRLELFKKISEANQVPISDFHQEGIMQSVESTEKLLFSPALKAFNLESEPSNSYKAYSSGGKFGLGCLLARRLIEVGSRFVEVTSEYVPFGNWDTHKNGHKRTTKLKAMIDRPVTQLIKDLEERGMLDETLVVIASEFSRVAGRNPGKAKRSTDILLSDPSHYGLHRHSIEGGSIVMFGGGVRRGALYGETRDEFPCDAVTPPVSVSDAHATIYNLLGIPPDYGFEVEKRPFYVTQDGKGKAVKEVVA